jgi:hypothetical protein
MRSHLVLKIELSPGTARQGARLWAQLGVGVGFRRGWRRNLGTGVILICDMLSLSGNSIARGVASELPAVRIVVEGRGGVLRPFAAGWFGE